jgi:hypothetical protein
MRVRGAPGPGGGGVAGDDSDGGGTHVGVDGPVVDGKGCSPLLVACGWWQVRATTRVRDPNGGPPRYLANVTATTSASGEWAVPGAGLGESVTIPVASSTPAKCGLVPLHPQL